MAEAISNEEVQNLIESALPGADVVIDCDDGVHFATRVVAPQFEGQSLIQRHRLIYAALGDGMKERIHALSIKAYTPEEWSAQ